MRRRRDLDDGMYGDGYGGNGLGSGWDGNLFIDNSTYGDGDDFGTNDGDGCCWKKWQAGMFRLYFDSESTL